MLKDLDCSEVLKSVNKRDRLYQERLSCETRIEKLKEQLSLEEEKLKQFRSTVLDLQKEKGNFFDKLLCFFYRGKEFKRKQKINNLKSEISDIRFSINELSNNIEEYKEQLNYIKKYLRQLFKIVPSFITEKNGMLIINDNNFETDNYTFVSHSNQKRVPDYKKILIHFTNFFPERNTIKSSYDKEIVSTKFSFNGFKKSIKYLKQSDSIHFTINGMLDSFDKPLFIIVDDFNEHCNSISGNNCDSWIDSLSFNLSSIAIIMIDYKFINKIDKDKLEKINFVCFNGNPIKCLKNFLSFCNYPIFEINGIHSEYESSLNYVLEQACNLRNQLISFFSSGEFTDNIENLEFNLEQISHLLSSSSIFDYKQIPFNSDNLKKVNNGFYKDKFDDDKISFLNFIICSGLYRNNSGSFSFKSDEEIYSTLNNLKILLDREDYININKIIDFNMLLELYNESLEITKLYEGETVEQTEKSINSVFLPAKKKIKERSMNNGKI